MKKIDVGVIGPGSSTVFGMVGQKLLLMLENHPWFEVAALVAESPDQVGKKYKDTLQSLTRKWFWEEEMPNKIADMTMLPPDPKDVKKSADVEFMFSALMPDISKEIDPQFAKAGYPVISDSGGLRYEEDIPTLVPEINPEHLAIIDSQKKKRGWEGFVVTGPVCTVTVLALSMQPVREAFGLKNVFVTTIQALSGAGYTGVPSMGVTDNMIPFIGGEEEKVEKETAKLFGRVANGKIVSSNVGISSTCTRIGVLHGHSGCVYAETDKPVTIEEAARTFRTFQAEPQKLELPSAPKQPVIVRNETDRPQPRWDRSANANGMGVVVGRIRKEPIFKNGFKYVVVGHNHVRGTAGNSVLCAEYMYKKGLLKPKR
jgi:aspartate-semialdehyde dehydrogenase